MNTIIKQIRKTLKESVDAKAKAGTTRFFKEKIKFHGVRVPVVQKIGTQAFASIKRMSKPEIFALCDELWQSGYLEESFIACNWSYDVRDRYETGDFAVFEHWVGTYLDNWASCDSLCNHSVGTLLEMYPKLVAKLKPWTRSKNRWNRRSAAVSLIIPARKGLFQPEIFDIAERLLHDADDLVQKGYGWMLKAAADFDREAVFAFVMRHKKTMPRTALRYAVEKMPPDMRKQAMGKCPATLTRNESIKSHATDSD